MVRYFTHCILIKTKVPHQQPNSLYKVDFATTQLKLWITPEEKIVNNQTILQMYNFQQSISFKEYA